jgi:hypothetical protein
MPSCDGLPSQQVLNTVPNNAHQKFGLRTQLPGMIFTLVHLPYIWNPRNLSIHSPWIEFSLHLIGRSSFGFYFQNKGICQRQWSNASCDRGVPFRFEIWFSVPCIRNAVLRDCNALTFRDPLYRRQTTHYLYCLKLRRSSSR